MAGVKSVALIGSFRKHYKEVAQVESVFCAAGLEVTSPQGTCIEDASQPFVRFQNDRSDWSDEMVQTVTLHRIMRADFVYTVAPGGYVGRETCYEIGRAMQAGQPIYFSQKPKDLSISLPAGHLLTPEEIVQRIAAGRFKPRSLHSNIEGAVGKLERDLIAGVFSSL